ncbi:MAG TPA: murein biosynthesis integral membrane protein MurJ [Candidatus Binatia bacterium]|nr:murein biosynthesis integral membrane protein MurJ [Candidatus Binatia bacterium]
MPSSAEASSGQRVPGFWARLLRILRPSHQHTAFTATLLLMTAVMLSRVIGYLREAYIAWAFGAGLNTDAYVGAFNLPDFLNYILAGGTASITFIAIYTRHTSQGRDREAQEAFNSTITIMTAVVCLGTVLLEIFTPQLERLIFPHFSAAQLTLCVHLTRILLPGQIFFYAGGIVSAVLLSRRMFLYPAFSPIFYNVFIIVGGLVGARRFGIASLAWGALVGAIIGPFLINAIGAAQDGLGYRLNFDWRNREFREWVRLSIPLMLGVSLVSADDWILRYFASGGVGDITRLNYAKRLFAVPISILGQATGQASMPFFARLFGEGKRREFADTVNGSVFRISAASLLASAWMMPAALPLIDLVYRRGRFSFQDSRETAVFFFWFALSLALWSAQALYARAFYAASDTMTPMVASTIIVVASLPVYSAMFHHAGVTGLAIASDIGILMHTVVLAWLLDRRKLVRLGDMQWLELGKSLATAALAAAAGYAVARIFVVNGSRRADLLSLVAISAVWLAAAAVGLWLTKSILPQELRRKRAPANPNISAPEAVVERTTGGVQP